MSHARTLDGIHVHLLETPASGNVPDSLLAVLDDAEQIRAARIDRARGRVEYVMGRAFFRSVLASYRDVTPGTLLLARAVMGKPTTSVLPNGSCALHASSSASGRMHAVAVTGQGPIGIDIEPVAADRFVGDLSDVVLSRREKDVYASIAEDSRTYWLTRVWVAKEATLKAMGCGLSIAPSELDVSLNASDVVSVRAREWREMDRPANWWIFDFVWQGSVGAIAVPNSCFEVQFHYQQFAGESFRSLQAKHASVY